MSEGLLESLPERLFPDWQADEVMATSLRKVPYSVPKDMPSSTHSAFEKRAGGSFPEVQAEILCAEGCTY